MPSTTSSSLARPEPSSTVITPSLPTFSIASAMVLPIDSSLFAEIVPTWAIAFESLQGFDSFFSSSVTVSTARSTPRLMSIGLAPAATALRPSRTIAWASTVAVVVPSPASPEVLDATSFTICAPMFSNLSLSSISFATLTPSFVTVGAPKLFSSTALRPLGPSVTLTALARMLTPRIMRVRASSLKRTSLAAMYLFSGILWCVAVRLLLDHRHHVFFAHDEVLLAIDLHFGPAVLAEEDVVTDLDVERADVAVLEDLALAHRDDLAADRLLGRRVGDHDAAGSFGLRVEPLDDDAIMEGTNLQFFSHCCRLRSVDWMLSRLLGKSGVLALSRVGC